MNSQKTGRTGRIVAGALAPHPPHLVYAENPVQNEPRSECGWEELRWGYQRLRKSLDAKKQKNSEDDFDVILVHSPHWRTSTGHHIMCGNHFKGLSVDPVFPHLFRYQYDIKSSPALAHNIFEQAKIAGLQTELMTQPDFRVDYGTIVSCHMVRPQWDKPIVCLSSSSVYDDFSVEVGDAQMIALGIATRKAVEQSGLRALLLASCSLSHRHFTQEPSIPEDMTYEHIYNYNQYLWDMRVLKLLEAGKCQSFLELHSDFIEQSASETRSGSLTWMLAALGFPKAPAQIHAYGTVIGTGNAIVEFEVAP